jgi:hypothetical protein
MRGSAQACLEITATPIPAGMDQSGFLGQQLFDPV